MKTFDLPAQCRVKLTKATPRKETHGKDLVQAISLRLEWWPTDNAAVNLLHDGLQDALWWVPPEAAAQGSVEGVPPVKKHRRVPTMAMPIKVELSLSGYTLTIDHGIDDSTALELYAATLDKFEVEAKEGGSVVIRWSLASNKQITPQLVGALCGLEGCEVVVTLTPPKPDTVIDGSKEAFQADHPDAGDLFAAEHGSAAEGGDGSTGPEGDGEGEADDDGSGHPDAGAAEQAELEAGMRESIAADGVKPKRGRAVAH